jgi:enamine deaminase RidA (YjgF/YER057c/UK114 family)
VGAYVPAVRSGNMIYLAGQIPMRDGSPVAVGKVDADLKGSDIIEPVRVAVLNGLAALKAEIGSLDKVRRLVKLVGYVASSPGFTNQAAVLNHASNLMLAVFGEKGRHARVAIGVAELPLGVPVELDMIFEVEPEAAEHA